MVVAGAGFHLKKYNATKYREKHQMVHTKGVPIGFIETCGLEAKGPMHPNTLSPTHTKSCSIHRKLVDFVIWLKLKADTEEYILYYLDGQALNQTSCPPIRHRSTAVSIDTRSPFSGGSTAVV